MKPTNIMFFLFIVIMFFLFGYFMSTLTGKAIVTREIVNVSKVVDGDTFKDQIGQSYRLLGINTPEKNMPFHDEALAYLKQYEGKIVELEIDKEDYDKYGRKLRFIFYNNKMINKEILRLGLANFYSYGSSYDAELLNAENSARNNELGLWTKSRDKCAYCIILVSLDKGGQEGHEDDERVIFNNICSFSCNLEGWTMKDDANHIYKFDETIEANKILEIKQKSVWNDERDSLFLRDNNGGLVVFYRY